MKIIKGFIRSRKLLFKILEPIYIFFASIPYWLNVLLGDKGILQGYVLYPLISIYRVVRAAIQRSYLKSIKKIKNQFSGKRCFIVAGGPSLRIEDLEVLHKNQEYTFGLNSIYRLYNQTNWRPDFYCCIDLELEHEIEALGKNIFEDMGNCKIFLDSRVKTIPKSDKIEFVHYNRLLHEKGMWNDDIKYSDNLIFGLFDMYDVTISSIQIAKYMGFSEVYLLGVDCNYTGKKKYMNGIESDLSKDISEDHYEYIQKQKMKCFNFLYIKTKNKKNFNIFNATRGGKLEAFKRVNFDDLFLEE